MVRNLPIARQDSAHQRASRQVKKQKLSHPDFPPPSYFDNLPETYLTRFVLWEFDRRNAEARRPSNQTPQRTRPNTRLAVAQWKDRHPSAERLIEQCSSETLEQIRRYAMHGGPNLTDLRGFWAPDVRLDYMMSLKSSLGRRKRASDSHDSSYTEPSRPTKTTGPYDRAFKQHIIDHGIFTIHHGYLGVRASPKPENYKEILEVLAKPRVSLDQFSEEDYDKFAYTVANASNEREVITSIMPCLEGEARDGKYIAGGVSFRNLDHLTDGSLVAANPDQYHGARPEQLHRTIREELDNYIIPSTQKDLPVAPNFFLEAKGPQGTQGVAILQACYNGALGARGIHNLRAYRSIAPTTYDNKAYTITATYVGGMLTIYTTHPVRAGVRTQLVMTQLCAFALTGGLKAFRDAAAAYRNAIDWAAQQRDLVIEQANERAAERASTPSDASGPGLGQHENMIKSLDSGAPASPHGSNANDKAEHSLDAQLPRRKRRSTKASRSRGESVLATIPEVEEGKAKMD
ncbi:hypothetical protein B0T10DRAFT_460707 [Thelonectria olida]|uniref:Uncharacterized protein n=1 Tax=Thelonectria olida TaxID=1576542 RepID=A0A9P8W4V5_9HYPO|nr:hypothetical protein B0T10DRAFT_460707 [Thelonectria olida]